MFDCKVEAHFLESISNESYIVIRGNSSSECEAGFDVFRGFFTLVYQESICLVNDYNRLGRTLSSAIIHANDSGYSDVFLQRGLDFIPVILILLHQLLVVVDDDDSIKLEKLTL